MKNFSFLKSAWALFAAVALAMPAKADVASVADLYGTYKFTATVEVTEAGQSLTDHFKSECDVVITKCSYNIYDGEIQGLAGATAAQKINGIDAAEKVIKITNPNGNGLWGGGLYMSNAEGKYPFAAGDTYGDITYAYDAETKTITMPTFTLVTCDHANQAASVVATFTNATLTLVEAENIEVVDLSGDWHYTAGKGTYDTMEGSNLPLEWDMNLTATDANNKAYAVNITLGDFAPLALNATFDGAKLTIPFDSVYFDAENRICLWDPYGGRYKGNVEFNMVNENTLSLSMMYIRQDSISPEVKAGAVQYYMNGSAKKQDAEEVATTWDGTYNVKVGALTVGIADYAYPEEFEMEVKYFDEWGIYLVTKFFGNDVTGLNNGGIRLTPSADDPNKAEIKTGSYLQTIVGGESYLCLMDLNLSNSSSIVLTRLEDGTYTLGDFSISYLTYNADWSQNHAFAAYCQQVTAEKIAVEEPETFSWASTFTVKANNVAVYNDAYSYPAEFEMEVQYFEDWGIYLVTKFFGNDVTGLNNGGINFTVSADDPNKAEMATGRYLQTIVGGESYLCLMDMNASNASKLTLTRGEDGTITISDFCVTYMTYDANWNQNHTLAAFYTSVSAVEGALPEPEPEVFSWVNTFTVKANNVAVYNDAYSYPAEFEMEVQYFEDWGIYLVTKFFGNDVTGLNNGGINFTVSADDPNKAEMATGRYLQTIVGGESYLCLMDMNASSTSNLVLTHGEDGTITISDFCVTYMTYDASWNQNHTLAAFYTGVSAVEGATSIEEAIAADAKIVVADGTIIVGEAQQVEVYDMSGRIVFAGVASQVSGLNNGLYVVRVANNAVKVVVK